MRLLSPRVLAVALAIALPAVAGAQLRGTDAPSTPDSRTGPVSIDAGGNYTTDFNIAWSIGPAQGGLLLYSYTLTGFGPPGISHLIVGLSDGCGSDPLCVSDVRVGGQSTSDWEIDSWVPGENGGSNPGLANTFYGIKINTPGSVEGEAGVTFSFLSNRAPVYGDFYAKGGSGSYAQNDGLLTANLSSNDPALFIVRPDTQPASTVPEPGSVALLGAGLAALGGAARRRRAARA